MLHDRARIHVQAGARRQRLGELPPRGARPARRTRTAATAATAATSCSSATPSLRDLQSFRRRTHYRAPAGGDGGASQRHGARGEQLLVRVPPGTEVRDDDGLLFDLTLPGPARRGRARRRRRPRQPALRDPDARRPALRRARPRRARSAGSS